MKVGLQFFIALGALLAAAAAQAAGADLGQVDKQPTNWVAIGMFGTFVVATLFITKWAAGRTKSAADFYTGGGQFTGPQNGFAIAGDYLAPDYPATLEAAVRSGQDAANKIAQ